MVFGISSISPVITTSNRIEEISKIVVDYAKELICSGQSFALRTRRTGKHPYTSMELAKVLGSEVLDSFKGKNIKVDLSLPDVEIFIEVRHDQAFVFSKSYGGPGGLPLGTQGKVVSIITGLQAYIASWLMMKRGCRVYPVFFKNKSSSSGIMEGHAKRQVELLKSWVPNINLRIIDLDDDSDNFLTLSGLNNDELFDFARWAKAKGVCLSINYKEFSKHSEQLKAQTNSFPLFYPLIGLDAKEIQKLGQKIKEKST
jgi:thiamine biosynthesis protein ThiI